MDLLKYEKTAQADLSALGVLTPIVSSMCTLHNATEVSHALICVCG
jgi:poly(A) polymerase Pap1